MANNFDITEIVEDLIPGMLNNVKDDIKNFEDLINIEEELRIPILFYELEKDDEAWFIITTETQAYRYILKSTSHLLLK